MLKFLQLADYKRAKVLPKLFWQHLGKNAAKIAPDFWQRFAGIAVICGNTKTRQNLINRGFNSSFAAGKSGFLRAAKIAKIIFYPAGFMRCQ